MVCVPQHTHTHTHTYDHPLRFGPDEILHDINVAEIPWGEEAEMGESSHASNNNPSVQVGETEHQTYPDVCISLKKRNHNRKNKLMKVITHCVKLFLSCIFETFTSDTESSCISFTHCWHYRMIISLRLICPILVIFWFRWLGHMTLKQLKKVLFSSLMCK